MARVLIALLMMGSLIQAEEPISLSLDMTQAALLPPAAPERFTPLQPISYTHTDIVIRLPGIPTGYVAFISPSGGLGMMRVSSYERPDTPFRSTVGNALVVKPPSGFR